MTEAPYGTWKSPITSELIVAGTIGLGQIAVAGEAIYWVEMRPAEGGRNVVVCYTPDGAISDVTPAPFNVRTRVHEYGGGAFAVAGDTIYFSNFADQHLYRQTLGAAPEPLTTNPRFRYADGVIDARHQRLICVREDHSPGEQEAVNTLVSVSLAGGDNGQILTSGSDFYASPRLSPDGSHLAWISWNHPHMPWDSSELWVAPITEDGKLGAAQQVAGGPEESIFQPEWSPDGTLYFVSDRNGWRNLYRWQHGQVEPLVEMEAEFGLPQWVFGMSTYGFANDNEIICTYNQRGTWQLARLDTVARQLEPMVKDRPAAIATPYTDISSLKVMPGRVLFLGSSATEPPAIVQLDLETNQPSVLRRSTTLSIDPGYLSVPEIIEFPTENGLTAYGFFYRPNNKDYVGPPDQRPPLLVKSHGGPTAAASSSFRLGFQYWTSRGFAVLDVNYGGSTGFGRAYQQRLDGQWGVVDVDDCVNGAKYLVEQGEVDGDRQAITGGSAGGYTTLCALTFRDTFKAGASHYGVSDLEALVRDTHKFESRYLDRLIGPYPEKRDLYRARSPIHFSDRLSCPVIFFQGLEDKIVPPNQAETMVEALAAKGLPVAYVPFEGEQHGFRRSENIKRALDAEFYFYARIFGFEPADPLEPVLIQNF